MGLNKINFKIIIYILCIFFSLGLSVFYYNKYLEKVMERELIAENIDNIVKNLGEMEKKRNIKLNDLMENEKKLDILIKKLELLNVEDEGEFKKIIYIFANESGLKLKEISKAEKIWERGQYRLIYLYFTLFGSLNDFGKFIYLVNKSKKYIDTRKTYIELTGNEFKVSLGFLEKIENEVEK